MNDFQQKIEAWLSRRAPDRAVNHCFDLSVVLATDVGIRRTENQDRVAALRIGAKVTRGRPLIAVAVADGMGGMRDGAKCATLALSSFFSALVSQRNYDTERRAMSAISYANDAVFQFANAKGGTTLSAIVFDHELRAFVVHVGDSRIYSFGGGIKGIDRLTIDDSLEEAVGGHGRELLQFVGMGEGMRPHIRSIPLGIQTLAITTDGIHFIGTEILGSILLNASDLKAASERLSALARWCGGHDNASSALINLESLAQTMKEGGDEGIQVWDPFGALTAIWIGGNYSNFQQRALNVREPDGPPIERVVRSQRQELVRSSSKTKQSSKKTKGRKKIMPQKDDIQLEIHVEPSSDSKEIR